MEMFALSSTNSPCVGQKIQLCLRGRLTPLAITEAIGLATAQAQHRRVSTTFFAPAPSYRSSTSVVSRDLANSVVTKKLLRAQSFAVLWAMGHKTELLLRGHRTLLATTNVAGLGTARENGSIVSKNHLVFAILCVFTRNAYIMPCTLPEGKINLIRTMDDVVPCVVPHVTVT